MGVPGPPEKVVGVTRPMRPPRFRHLWKQPIANQIKFYCVIIIIKIESWRKSHKFLKARKLKMGAPSNRVDWKWGSQSLAHPAHSLRPPLIIYIALTFRDFVPRFELLTLFRDFRKSLKMCKINHFSLFCKSRLVLFLTFIMALRFYATPSQI